MTKTNHTINRRCDIIQPTVARTIALTAIILLAWACTDTINGCEIKPETQCTGADLRGANLSRATLTQANLSRADLREADLSGANPSGANLSNANLSGANLSDANLRDANLRDANLRDANLHQSSLGGADLRGADLRGADLSFANSLDEANLKGAIYNTKTLWRVKDSASGVKMRASYFDAVAAGAVLVEDDAE